jgi:two-component system, chemotaxis family, protein-glutamate methylesterase/glutaminase
MDSPLLPVPPPYAAFDIVAIAASLGGMEAAARLLSAIPRDFPAVITLVQHLGPSSNGLVPRILGRSSMLPVQHAEPDDTLLPGRVYVAPPDRHFFITRNGRASVLRSPRVKFTRPAADPLLVSAALCYGPRTLGVVLTGASTDGASGAQAIKWAGGMVLAQDQASSRAFAMPRAAIATGCVDMVLPIEVMGQAIVALVMMRGAADFLRVPLHAA